MAILYLSYKISGSSFSAWYDQEFETQHFAPQGQPALASGDIGNFHGYHTPGTDETTGTALITREGTTPIFGHRNLTTITPQALPSPIPPHAVNSNMEPHTGYMTIASTSSPYMFVYDIPIPSGMPTRYVPTPGTDGPVADVVAGYRFFAAQIGMPKKLIWYESGVLPALDRKVDIGSTSTDIKSIHENYFRAMLAIGSSDGLDIADLSGGNYILAARPPQPPGITGAVREVRWDPSQTFLAVAYEGSPGICVYETQWIGTGLTLLGALPGAPSGVSGQSVAWSPGPYGIIFPGASSSVFQLCGLYDGGGTLTKIRMWDRWGTTFTEFPFDGLGLNNPGATWNRARWSQGRLIAPGTPEIVTPPPLRQRQRNDRYRQRAGQNYPSSKQGSIRAGTPNTYARRIDRVGV